MTEITAEYTIPGEKPWKCRACGNVLGVVRRNSSTVRQLHTRDIVITGWAAVTCTCGAVRYWVAGEDALKDLLEGRGKRLD